jgi:hypothetical protein
MATVKNNNYMIKEPKIYVLYVGVQGIRSEDIPYFVTEITKRIAPENIEGEIIVIPTQAPDTRIECINPKYITDADLVAKHTEMMKKLSENLQHQLGQLKEEENG